MLVRVEQNRLGPRLFVGGWRWHHAHTGAGLIAIGAWLIFGDRRDFPWIDRLAAGGQPTPIAEDAHRRGTPRPILDPEIGQTTSHCVW